MMLLAACATPTGSGATGDRLACLGFAPIGWSKLDTDATIRAVKEHNAAWVSVCGKPPSGGKTP